MDGAERTEGAASAWMVFRTFLRLGLTSFGGPAAHIGYFRAEFVERRGWLSSAAFADLVALCQFLPGPASSQVGYAIGLRRAGIAGGLAAWLGFTLPSAALMIGLGLGVGLISAPGFAGVVHGLKLAAVAVVAQAVYDMARTLAASRVRAGIAALGFALAILIGGYGQLLALAAGAVAGLWLGVAPTSEVEPPLRLSWRLGFIALGLFGVLLAALPMLATLGVPGAAPAWAYYRTGALVFGGGHVVLPLLQDAVVRPGWIDQGVFLSGYAAAQALPGPLFAFAAYLGTAERIAPAGLAGGLTALVLVFLPGLLLTTGALPFWTRLKASARARRVMAGANAAVVGVLGAALYSPVFTGGVRSSADMVVAVAAVVALTALRAPPIAVVAICGLLGPLLLR
jgi:chromate transporter